jgi:D-3-phosphoglycerate dehydrogenase
VEELKLEWVGKDTIYREADVISIHVPLTHLTRGMIGREELRMMKPDVLLLNTARGGIVDEQSLLECLDEGRLGGVALDVFVDEPYAGALNTFERCLLTCHMGSMSVDCRTQMEIEATEEVIRFLKNEPLMGLVPDAEFDNQERDTPS